MPPRVCRCSTPRRALTNNSCVKCGGYIFAVVPQVQLDFVPTPRLVFLNDHSALCSCFACVMRWRAKAA